MQRLALVMLVLALAAACKKKADQAPAATGSGTAAGTAASAADAALAADPVARGEYIAGLAGCPVCHTPLDASGVAPDRARAYAGGLEVTEVFGTWRAPNITPDRETGIGAWSDAEITAAIREGKRRDGSMLKAVMPYTFYAGMSDDDVQALVAYLRSLPPVVNKTERLVPPLPDVPAPALPRVDVKDDPVKHGQYLAGLMHCALCHTPVGPNGPELDKLFAGGVPIAVPPAFGTGVLYSSNITSDVATGIGKWTEDDVIKAVRMTVRPDNRPILGPMMLYVPYWSRMTDADARAVAAYIKSVPAVAYTVPASTFKPAVPAAP